MVGAYGGGDRYSSNYPRNPLFPITAFCGEDSVVVNRLFRGYSILAKYHVPSYDITYFDILPSSPDDRRRELLHLENRGEITGLEFFKLVPEKVTYEHVNE